MVWQDIHTTACIYFVQYYCFILTAASWYFATIPNMYTTKMKRVESHCINLFISIIFCSFSWTVSLSFSTLIYCLEMVQLHTSLYMSSHMFDIIKVGGHMHRIYIYDTVEICSLVSLMTLALLSVLF